MDSSRGETISIDVRAAASSAAVLCCGAVPGHPLPSRMQPHAAHMRLHAAADLTPPPPRTHDPPSQVDVTFPRMPCSWLSLDAMDVSGELHLDVVRLGFWGVLEL